MMAIVNPGAMQGMAWLGLVNVCPGPTVTLVRGVVGHETTGTGVGVGVGPGPEEGMAAMAA